MSAYVIVMVTVEDPETYRKYTDRTPPTIARYGGRFLTRGGAVKTLEGAPYQGRLVLSEFPTPEAAADRFKTPTTSRLPSSDVQPPRAGSSSSTVSRHVPPGTHATNRGSTVAQIRI